MNRFLIATIFTLVSSFAFSAKIQQQGIKTHADCSSAGASDASCLPLDSQIWASAATPPQSLSSAIATGVLGGGVPVGTILPFSGFTAPTGFFLCDTTAYSRTTYVNLFNTTTIQGTGTFTSGSGCIASPSTVANIQGLYFISGPDIPSSTIVLGVPGSCSSGQIQISNNATASGTAAFVISPYGIGDGSTTFNVPNPGAMALTFAGSSMAEGNSYTRTLGIKEADQIQGHEHSITAFLSNGVAGNGASMIYNGNTGSNDIRQTSGIVTDGTNGTPRVGSETRMANQAFNCIIKY